MTAWDSQRLSFPHSWLWMTPSSFRDGGAIPTNSINHSGLSHWVAEFAVMVSAVWPALSAQLPAGNRQMQIVCTCSKGWNKFLQLTPQIPVRQSTLPTHPVMLLQGQIKPCSTLTVLAPSASWRSQMPLSCDGNGHWCVSLYPPRQQIICWSI